MSMTLEGFKERVTILMGRGYSEEAANHIAELLGDKIEEQDGKWIARDDAGKIVDRIDPI